MRTRRMWLLSGVVLLALAAAGAGLYAQQKSTGSRKLSAEDWIEIRQLYGRYAHAVDSMNSEAEAEAVANLWVEDGVWDSNADQPPHRGRKAIGATYVGTYKRRFEGLHSPRRFYEDISVVIDPSPEGAVGRAYFAMVKSAADAQGQPSVEISGEYHDVFVKTRDGWKFKSRVFRRFQAEASPAPTPAR